MGTNTLSLCKVHAASHEQYTIYVAWKPFGKQDGEKQRNHDGAGRIPRYPCVDHWQYQYWRHHPSHVYHKQSSEMLKKSSIKFQKALLLENCMCKLEALCIWRNCFAVKRASDCSKTTVVGVPSEKKTPSKSDI